MSKQTTEEEWSILSDSELVKRARRLTVAGLLIAVGFMALAGYMFGTSPVQEQGGAPRAVHIPYSPTKPAAQAKGPEPPPSAASAALPPSPWAPKPEPKRPPAPAPVADGKIWDM